MLEAVRVTLRLAVRIFRVSPQAALLFLLLLQVPLLPLGGLCRLALLFARNRLLVGQRQVIDIPHLVAQCVALFSGTPR